MDNSISRLIDLTIAIQQLPAPTFHEAERAEFVRARFAEEGFKDVGLDPTGNVCARLAAKAPERPPVIVCAHLDTVFPLSVDLHCEREAERILGPGIGDN